MKAAIRLAASAAAALLWGLSAAVALPGNSTVADFARAPALGHASLSPGGALLAFVDQQGDRERVVVRSLDTGGDQILLTLDIQRERVRWCGWSGDVHLLCGTVMPVRAPQGVGERSRLYSLDVDGSRVRLLNARMPAALQDQVIDFMPQDPRRVLLQYDLTGSGYPRVAELDIITGGMRRITGPRPPVRRWLSDGRGRVLLGVGYDEGIGTLFRPGATDDEWELLSSHALSDPEVMGPLAFGATPRELYVLKHHAGRAALHRFDTVNRGEPSLLFADPQFDVAGPLILDPLNGSLLAVRYLTEHESIHFFSATEAAHQLWLDSALPERVNAMRDRTLDGRYWLVESYSDQDPPSLYRLDTRERKLELLGHQYPELEVGTWAPMHPVVYPARDGQQIAGYLTLPAGADVRNLPAVVLPHGGPETRDYWRFDPFVQFLAAQGYAVLQMNFRGSLGYGARFTAAGMGQWGGVIHNDITDGARWLVSQGVADPERLCIVGASFGGYAAMLAATRESQWYACAVAYAGVSDLIAFATSTERRVDAELWRERLGSDRRILYQMSPLTRARTAETPLLLIHGRLDAVVPLRQSTRLARALRQEGKDVRLEERSDCDHDLVIQTCRAFFFEQVSAFLAERLQRDRD